MAAVGASRPSRDAHEAERGTVAMRAHHGFAGGLLAGVAVAGNAPFLIGAGILIGVLLGFVFANVNQIIGWLGTRKARRYG